MSPNSTPGTHAAAVSIVLLVTMLMQNMKPPYIQRKHNRVDMTASFIALLSVLIVSAEFSASWWRPKWVSYATLSVVGLLCSGMFTFLGCMIVKSGWGMATNRWQMAVECLRRYFRRDRETATDESELQAATTCDGTWETTFGPVQIVGETGTYLGDPDGIFDIRWSSPTQVEGRFRNAALDGRGQFCWRFHGPERDRFTGTWSWDDDRPASLAEWNGYRTGDAHLRRRVA